MYRLKSFLALLLFASALPLTANADDADVLREAADRAEIQALMWRYVRALDTLDPEAYAAVFTPDGQFGSGSNSVKGRAALETMVEGLRENASGPAMYHVISNDHIEFVSADRARYHSYWMTVFAAAEDEGTPRVAAAGRGVDELVRVDGEWLIRFRDVAPDE